MHKEIAICKNEFIRVCPWSSFSRNECRITRLGSNGKPQYLETLVGSTIIFDLAVDSNGLVIALDYV